MSEFNNVTVVKAANVYFEGKVISRVVKFADGTKKTLGFMQPGEYTFDTDGAEIMEFMSGELTVILPDREEPLEINGECTFEVPAKSQFTLKVRKGADYCCSYL